MIPEFERLLQHLLWVENEGEPWLTVSTHDLRVVLANLSPSANPQDPDFESGLNS